MMIEDASRIDTDPFDRSRELLALTAIAAAVAQSLELKPLLATALDHVLDLLGFEAGGIFGRGTGETYEVLIERGLDHPDLAPFRHMHSGDGVVGRIAATGRSEIVADLRGTAGAGAALVNAGLLAMAGVPLLARGSVVGILVVFRHAPYEFPARTIRLLESAADHIALAVDNARLYAAEQQRRQQSEALRQGMLALTEALDLDTMLGRIVDQAISLTAAPMCALYELNGTTQRLQRRITRGLPPTYIVDEAVEVGGFAVGEAVQREQAVCYKDLATCRAHLRADAGRVDLPFASLQAAPLIVQRHVYGGIVVYYNQEQAFDDDSVRLLRVFADQAALALEHARLNDQARELAALQERQRLARDLHDSVSQTLFSLKLAAQATRTTLATEPAAAEALLETVQELASAALAEMRALIFELRPTALAEAGLSGALERQTAAFHARSRVPVKLDVQQRRCPLPIEEALYRVAGEALANVARHARASEVEVSLRVTDEFVTLVVRDNGQGFDPAVMPVGDHVGRRSMQERINAIGGHLTIRSAPNVGTCIEVTVPLAEGRRRGTN